MSTGSPVGSGVSGVPGLGGSGLGRAEGFVFWVFQTNPLFVSTVPNN